MASPIGDGDRLPGGLDGRERDLNPQLKQRFMHVAVDHIASLPVGRPVRRRYEKGSGTLVASPNECTHQEPRAPGARTRLEMRVRSRAGLE